MGRLRSLDRLAKGLRPGSIYSHAGKLTRPQQGSTSFVVTCDAILHQAPPLRALYVMDKPTSGQHWLSESCFELLQPLQPPAYHHHLCLDLYQ